MNSFDPRSVKDEIERGKKFLEKVLCCIKELLQKTLFKLRTIRDEGGSKVHTEVTRIIAIVEELLIDDDRDRELKHGLFSSQYSIGAKGKTSSLLASPQRHSKARKMRGIT